MLVGKVTRIISNAKMAVSYKEIHLRQNLNLS